MTAATYLPVLERRVEEALDTIARRAPGTDGGALATALHGCYSTVKPLLEARAWRARDGHGDLRAEHVWIGTPVQVIDALEFDAQLRLMDPLEDLAMLAVDAEHAGSSWLVPALRQAYETSTSDHVPNAIWLFYLALRAATRAKVALWRIEEPEAGDPRRWRAKVEEFLALGLRYLDAD
jgi:aminoglycoside phosphotransferase family enzyme